MAFHFNKKLQLPFSVSLTLLGISGIPRGISGIARREVRRIQSDGTAQEFPPSGDHDKFVDLMSYMFIYHSE